MKLWNVTLTTREIIILLKLIKVLGITKYLGYNMLEKFGIMETEIQVLREKLDRTPIEGQHIGEIFDDEIQQEEGNGKKEEG